MGYSEFDCALLDAWQRVREQCKDDPAKCAAILRRRGMSTYTRPLRSWSLVLRANDKRIEDDNAQGLVRMDGARVRRLCSPVVIPYPGVSLDEAAGLFGVNRTTVSRWANPEDSGLTWWRAVRRQMDGLDDASRFGGPVVYRVAGRRLMLEHEVNRANAKRSVTRVWTPGRDGLDPGGEVSSADWGRLRTGLAEKVPSMFVQELQRVDRRLTRSGRAAMPATPCAQVFHWVCPLEDGGCGRLVYKLFLSMPCWTLAGVSDVVSAGEPSVEGCDAGFLCQRCSGLLYESAERASSPGRRRDGARRRVDGMDRLIKRLSAGVLGRGDVFLDC